MGLAVTDAGDDEWLRPIDLTVDSDAPEQIALELGHRHELYLREAQRLLHDGLVPDEAGLAAGIRAETRRYLRSHPWHGHASLAQAVTEAEEVALEELTAIVGAAAVATARAPGPPPARPVRRLALQPSATIVGNMAVRKKPTATGLELSWDATANVVEWRVRVSTRLDPRRDYVEGEVVTLPAGTTSFVVELDEHPRRIQLYGHARDGRIVRRAIVSALTSGNSAARWKRQASAS